MVVLTGTTQPPDPRARARVRAACLLLGAVPAGALLAAGAWAWAAVPLALALALARGLVILAGDRPSVLELHADHLVLEDRARGRLDLPLAEVHAATVLVRPVDADRSEALLVLADPERVRLAVRFLVEPHLPLRQEDVRLDVLDALLGHRGGLDELAPPRVRARQDFDDPAGQAIRFLRERLPAATWARTPLRAWRGEGPPPGDDAPDAFVLLDGDTWTCARRGEVRSGALALVRALRAIRTDAPGAAGLPPRDVPVLAFELHDDLFVATPAEGADLTGTSVAEDLAWLHTTPIDGAALVWHVLCRWPESAWPVSLRAAADAIARPDPLLAAAGPSSGVREPSSPRRR